MSEPPPPETPPTDGSSGAPPLWAASALPPDDHVRVLTEHFLNHRRTHTLAALGRAALGAGYSHEEIELATANVTAQLATSEASAPTRSIAQRAILAAYGLTYLVFAIVFLTQRSSSGIGPIALMILTVALGLALGLSALWASRSRWRNQGASVKLVSILSVPIVLLVLVAGTCVVTTFPSLLRS